MVIKVFFDMSADGKPVGRVIMDLYNDVVPKTAGSSFSSFFFFLNFFPLPIAGVGALDPS